MNAAQTSHLTNFPTARGERVSNQKSKARAASASSKSIKRAAKKRGSNKRALKTPVSLDDVQCCECLQQAEICREQAQEAARMKRFKAARGLFATAIALCQSALSACARNKERAPHNAAAPANASADNSGERLSEDAILNADDAAIQAYLQQLNIEMATYSDLARSMERPLR